MSIVCVVECDDCGKSLINNSENISIFYMDTFLGVVICPQCDIPIIKNIGEDTVKTIASKGAKVFSFRTGEEMCVV